MSNHTPGPWTIGEQTVRSADGFVIAEVYGLTPPEAEANMRLMGAAADLLQSCVDLLISDVIGDRIRATSDMRAAIKRATGQL